MNRLLRGVAVAVALFAGGLTALPARASGDTGGVMKVSDDAGVFSADAASKAKDAFQGTTFHSTTHLYVYTTDSIPANKKADFDAAKDKADTRGRFFKSWAKELAASKDRKGDVFVLLYRTEKAYYAVTVADEQSDRFRHFNDKKTTDVTAIFTRAMKTVHDQKLAGDAAKKEMDPALASATELVIQDLKDTSAPEAGHRTGGHDGAVNNNHREGRGVGGWLCMIACILLGVWLVTALIRAFTGGGGYGGGYGGGGYGGGGGGFFSSLLGGMFGAAAGMWMYNNFFGGSSYYGNDAMAGDSYGNDAATDTGDGNYDGGSEAGDGGGDWGDSGGDAGGGDWGDDAGGGGDWGGGGDFGGGGGDFGGGGGDW